jgi:hypothetical protein
MLKLRRRRFVFAIERRSARSTTEKKMPDVDLAIRHPAFSRCVQQILNCALLVVSLSLGFFRFQGLNGMSNG